MKPFREGLYTRFPVLIIVLLSLVMIVRSPSFFSLLNIRNIFDHSAPYVIMSLCMTAVIASGGIDLSVGSVVAFSGVVVVSLMHAGLPVWLAVALTLFIGCCLGGLNGFIITRFQLMPYVVTLATMSVYRGLTLIITQGKTLYHLPQSFAFFGKGHYGEINFPIVFAIGFTLLFVPLFFNTRWGQYAMALGSNPSALHRCAVPVHRYRISIYALMGVGAALAACILTSRISAADPGTAYMLETDVIAAVLLGGTRLRGMGTRPLGSALAAVLLVMMRNALTHLSVSPYYHALSTGLILLISVMLSELARRRQRDRYKTAQGGMG